MSSILDFYWRNFSIAFERQKNSKYFGSVFESPVHNTTLLIKRGIRLSFLEWYDWKHPVNTYLSWSRDKSTNFKWYYQTLFRIGLYRMIKHWIKRVMCYVSLEDKTAIWRSWCLFYCISLFNIILKIQKV